MKSYKKQYLQQHYSLKIKIQKFPIDPTEEEIRITKTKNSTSLKRDLNKLRRNYPNNTRLAIAKRTRNLTLRNQIYDFYNSNPTNTIIEID